MSSEELVSPSGQSIVGSLLSGEEDPTVADFQQARSNFGAGFSNFFKGLGFLSDPKIWIVIAVVIVLVLIFLLKGRG